MKRPADLTLAELLDEAELLLDRLNAKLPAWRAVARPNQLPPIGWDWFIWLILAGRGWGKTRTGGEWIIEKARRYPGARCALVAQTVADARDVMVEGESGLLSILEPEELRGGSIDTAWNRSMGELYLANGSRFKTYSSEKPRKLRGPQHHFTWGDEPTYWDDHDKGTAKDTTFSNMVIGTRLPARPGWDDDFRTQICLTCTPRRTPLLKVASKIAEENPARRGLLQRPDVVVTNGRTEENLANLTDTYRQTVIEPLVGTQLGRQELGGELIEDIEGALWSMDEIEDDRILIGALPPLTTIATGVDPAVTNTAESDETGIVTMGRGLDDHGYVLEDNSMRGSPLEWATEVWMAVLRNGSEAVVVEDNQGGDMVETSLLTAWSTVAVLFGKNGRIRPPIQRVHASLNKRARATPVGLLYEKHQVHHVLPYDLETLEDQMTTWDGEGDSPDRIDALVHVATYLFLPNKKGKTVVNSGRWSAINNRR